MLAGPLVLAYVGPGQQEEHRWPSRQGLGLQKCHGFKIDICMHQTMSLLVWWPRNFGPASEDYLKPKSKPTPPKNMGGSSKWWKRPHQDKPLQAAAPDAASSAASSSSKGWIAVQRKKSKKRAQKWASFSPPKGLEKGLAGRGLEKGLAERGLEKGLAE